jgi:hypothetical protein
MSNDVELQGFAVRRRSTRVLLKVRLLIKAADHNGDTYETMAETMSVNKHGARIRTQKPVLVGNYVLIIVSRTKRQQRARVVWRDLATSEYAVELSSPENLWGVTFPPEDWAEGATAESATLPESVLRHN